MTSENEIYFKNNFRSLTDFDQKLANIPEREWNINAKQITHPKHLEFLKEYVLSWTVLEEGFKPASSGIIFCGNIPLAVKYTSFILQRIHMRRRTVYYNNVYSLELECRNYENNYQQLKFLESVDLLGVFGFPFFIHGAPSDRPDLCMTPFHHMLLSRYNRMLPTIFISNYDQEKFVMAYDHFPADLQNALFTFNNFISLEKS